MEQLLPLTQLLARAVHLTSVSIQPLLLTLDLMRCVLKHDWSDTAGADGPRLSTQSRGRLLHELLTQHFSLMKMLACSIKKGKCTHVSVYESMPSYMFIFICTDHFLSALDGHAHASVEVALGKSLWLITWCTQTTSPATPVANGNGDTSEMDLNPHLATSGSTRVMAYDIVMETVLFKEMRPYFSVSTDSSSRSPSLSLSTAHVSPRMGRELLMTNSSLTPQLSSPSLLDKRDSLVVRTYQREVNPNLTHSYSYSHSICTHFVFHNDFCS